MIDPSRFHADSTTPLPHPGVQSGLQDDSYRDAPDPLGHLKSVLNALCFDDMFPAVQRKRGRPPEDRAALARSLVAKATLGIATTSELVERLHADDALRRVCGWRWRSEVPSQSTFSRAQAEFVARSLPVPVGARVRARIAIAPETVRPEAIRPEYELSCFEPDDGNALLVQLHATIGALVHHDRADLTLQQLAVFLACHAGGQRVTVAALRQELGVSSAAVVRCINRICVLGLAQRKTVAWDRRSIVIEPTEDGRALMRQLLTRVPESSR